MDLPAPVAPTSANLHSGGAYLSQDIDFILAGRVEVAELDAATRIDLGYPQSLLGAPAGNRSTRRSGCEPGSDSGG